MFRAATITAAALVAAAMVVMPLAYLLGQAAGLAAAGVAWGVCLASAVSAALIGGLFQRPEQAMFRILFGMALRMGLPLAAAMAIYASEHVLAEAGFVFYLMAFYFTALLVELVTIAAGSLSTGTHQAKAA